ncbi:MAG: NAD+ synthase [Candidatus Heimdallarchaeaceae archaeon]
MLKGTQRYQLIINKITKFIHEEVLKSQLEGAVIGVSGGVDSAVVAALTVKAIGKEKTSLIHLPENNLNSIHTNDAKVVSEELGIPLKIINISSILDSYISKIPQIEDSKLVKGNLKARIRAVILYSIANLEKKLVIGTSNKSELSIGYGTKYGDLAADIWPIADIYKTQLYEIAKILKINKRILTKPPTAGLWKNQTDEGEIGMPYAKLDVLLAGLEKNIKESTLGAELNLTAAQIQKIKALMKKNQHKLRMPNMCRISF